MDKYRELMEEIVGLVESGAHRNMDLAHYLEVIVGDLTDVVKCRGGRGGNKKIDRKYPKDTDLPLLSDPSSPDLPTVVVTPVRKSKGSPIPEDVLDREFHYWRHVYPKRAGSQDWPRAKQVYIRLRKDGVSAEQILTGTQHYKRHCERRDIVRTEFVMMAPTFLNRRDFEEEWPDPPQQRRPGVPPPPPSPPSAQELLEQSLARSGKMECGFCHAKVPAGPTCIKCGTANAVEVRHSHNSRYHLKDLPPTLEEQYTRDQMEKGVPYSETHSLKNGKLKNR